MTDEFPRWLGMILTIAGMAPAIGVSLYFAVLAMRGEIVFMPPMTASEGRGRTPEQGG
jgi:hypothetical protein